MSAADLADIRARHRRDWSPLPGGPDGPAWCAQDQDDWPCDAAALCDEVERLRDEDEHGVERTHTDAIGRLHDVIEQLIAERDTLAAKVKRVRLAVANESILVFPGDDSGDLEEDEYIETSLIAGALDGADS